MSPEKSDIIKKLNLDNFALCTVHRAENTDDIRRLSSIMSGLNKINKFVKIVLPLHPRTKKIIEQNIINTEFLIIEPVGYFDMIELLKHSSLVITDSGGLQKEAFFMGKSCVTLRDETEWMELIEKGYNVIAGAEKEKIISAVKKCCKKNQIFP